MTLDEAIDAGYEPDGPSCDCDRDAGDVCEECDPECPDCQGTGDGWPARVCSACRGTGERRR